MAGEDDDTLEASLRSGERPENSMMQPSMSQHSMTQQPGERSVGLRCLAASPDGHVFAGFHSGHLKCYTALGRLGWKKVPAQVPQHALRIPPAKRTLALLTPDHLGVQQADGPTLRLSGIIYAIQHELLPCYPIAVQYGLMPIHLQAESCDFPA